MTYVFIPAEAEIEAAVAAAMEPFDEAAAAEPQREYLSPGEIAAMAAHYGLPPDQLVGEMTGWRGTTGGIDDRGLFAVTTANPDGRWDWYEIGGRWDGHLPDNWMLAGSLRRSRLLKKLTPHDFITPDGVWHSRRGEPTRGWPPRFREKPARRWLAEFRTALEAHPDHRVVCVDRHS